MAEFFSWLHEVFGSYFTSLIIQTLGLIESTIVAIIVLHRRPLRRSPKWRIPVAVVYFFACIFLTALIREALSSTGVLLQVIAILVNVAYIYGLEWIIFDFRHEEMFLEVISVLAINAIVGRAYSLIVNACGVDDKSAISFLSEAAMEIQYLLYASIHLAMQAAFIPLFHQKRSPIDSQRARVTALVFSSVSMIILNIFLSVGRKYDDYLSPLSYINKGLCIIVGATALLLRSYVFYRNDKYEEKIVLDEMMKEEQSQFETLKSSISVINAKLHDLRHQIEGFQDRITEEELSRFQEAVESYGSMFDTGNRTLDIILYEKKMVCMDKKIGFSCLADGSAVARIDNTSLYSLLSNSIGNAIEASLKVDEAERYISVNIYSKAGIGYIEVSNRFTGQIIRGKDGNPITSKTEEKGKHGLGYRSMSLTAERYGGFISANDEGGIYSLTIAIPL